MCAFCGTHAGRFKDTFLLSEIRRSSTDRCWRHGSGPHRWSKASAALEASLALLRSFFSRGPLDLAARSQIQPNREICEGTKPCLSPPPRAWRSHLNEPADFSMCYQLDGIEPCGCLQIGEVLIDRPSWNLARASSLFRDSYKMTNGTIIGRQSSWGIY